MDAFRKRQEYQPIIDYYDQTWLDYRVLWFNDHNRSIHFGYFDPHTRTHSEALANMNRVLADKAGISAGDHVLDAGCGQGGSCFWLRENRQAEVVGISPVLSQIVHARQLARDRNLRSGCEFVQASYLETPFADETFDVVWACESVCHAPQKIDFYREAYRILKPGGRLVMAEYVRDHRPLSRKGEALLHGWLDGWAIQDIDTRDEHLQHLAEAGFVNGKVEDVTPHTRRSLGKLFWVSASLFPLQLMLRATNVRRGFQHGNVVGSIRQYQALRRGLWFYAIITAQKN